MIRAGLLAAALAFLGVAACGTDVNLGGASDASGPDADVDGGRPDDCDPCTANQECAANATCGQFSGDEFCATLCPQGNECRTDQTCKNVTTAAGDKVNACLPSSGSCPPVASPTADGGALVRCGSLSGPPVPSGCHSCGKFSDDCQPNGCYGGWWCNTVTRRCQRPPTSCP